MANQTFSRPNSITAADFEKYLERQRLSPHTIVAYTFTVNDFLGRFDGPTAENLGSYRKYLAESFSPATVNLRIRALDKYLRCCGLDDMQLQGVPVQQRSCLENLISTAEYERFKECLRLENNKQMFFCVCFMAMTGVRISELIKIQAHHVRSGHIDIYGKGGKFRRIFIPERLRAETLVWMASSGREEGSIFLNHSGRQISVRGVSIQLKRMAEKYGIDPSLVHPHAFRHLFAKNFIDRVGDVALLADLLGHSSIETTRIYLRRTGAEQKAIIEKAVDW